MQYRSESVRYIKFVTGGGLGLLVNLAVTYALTELLDMWFGAAYALGLSANVLFNFMYHRHFTFSQTGQALERLYKFIPLTLAVAAANYLVVRFLTEAFISNAGEAMLGGYYKYAVIIFVTTVLSIMNYAANRLWVFR